VNRARFTPLVMRSVRARKENHHEINQGENLVCRGIKGIRPYNPPNPPLPPKTISVFRRLPESLHALGRDPAIYVLIKHFFSRFFVPFVHFLLFFAPRNHLFPWFAGVSTKNCVKIGKIFVIFQSKVQLPENKNRKI